VPTAASAADRRSSTVCANDGKTDSVNIHSTLNAFPIVLPFVMYWVSLKMMLIRIGFAVLYCFQPVIGAAASGDACSIRGNDSILESLSFID
jgi:hypothetical protein